MTDNVTYKTFRTPKPYVVYVTVAPDFKRGVKEEYVGRVGPASDMAEAKRLIEDDKQFAGETFSGLIAPADTKGRRYRVFRAEWTEVTDGLNDTKAVA